MTKGHLSAPSQFAIIILMNKSNACKIVATVGSLEGRETLLEQMYLAGANVFRFNLSHADVEENARKLKLARAVEDKYRSSLGVFFDLQGPKLRVGVFKDGAVTLKDGQIFTLDLNAQAGDSTRVQLPHKEIFSAVQKGHILLFNDGLIRVRVEEVSPDKIITTVINGGELSNHKGVNVPDVSLPISALTERDRSYIEQVNKLNLDIDWFALSFVQNPQDILLARSLIKTKAGIISKIEKPQALEHLDKIIEYSDAIMVARGDLGVETAPERVPIIQRGIITACRRAGKPVIVATQMLESMIYNVTPTRAEASDVANAVFEGVDAVMLSAETANGKHPLESLRTMSRIIATVEEDASFAKNMQLTSSEPFVKDTSYAITAGAHAAAHLLETADLIINFTDTGTTTLRTARQRPCADIVSLTPRIDTARKMSLVWGVSAQIINKLNKFEDIENYARQAAQKYGIEKGKKVVITAGIPLGVAGDTNLLYIITV